MKQSKLDINNSFTLIHCTAVDDCFARITQNNIADCAPPCGASEYCIGTIEIGEFFDCLLLLFNRRTSFSLKEGQATSRWSTLAQAAMNNKEVRRQKWFDARVQLSNITLGR